MTCSPDLQQEHLEAAQNLHQQRRCRPVALFGDVFHSRRGVTDRLFTTREAVYHADTTDCAPVPLKALTEQGAHTHVVQLLYVAVRLFCTGPGTDYCPFRNALKTRFFGIVLQAILCLWPGIRMPNPRILIIEDNPDHRLILTHQLARMGIGMKLTG